MTADAVGKRVFFVPEAYLLKEPTAALAAEGTNSEELEGYHFKSIGNFGNFNLDRVGD